LQRLISPRLDRTRWLVSASICAAAWGFAAAADSAHAQGASAPEVVATAAPAAAKPASFPFASGQVRDDDLLLLETHLDNLTLSDGLAAYGAPQDPLLPVGELSRLLDLNLTVTPAEGRIVGLIGEAQRSLTIDLNSGAALLNGGRVQLAPEDVAVTGVDIYLRASALQRILPVKIEVDVGALELRLTALEKLPVQSRLDRLALMRSLHPDQQAEEEALRIASPYRLFSPPAIDTILQTGSSVSGPRFSHGYDVRIAGDVLYTDFQGYVGSDQNGNLANVRALLERRDAGGNLLGPLHATAASGGDVFTPALAIGPRSMGGRGFAVTTAPLEQTSVFNHIDLRGELPVGYDVQLYVNDILRSGQRTPVQGRYEFLNVPLARGVNVVRIVLNGPTGQRIEQTRIINVGGGQLAKGKLTFEMGVAQQETPLFPTPALGPGTGQQVSAGAGALRATAQMAYGLTEGATIIGGAAVYAPSSTQERILLTSGLRASVFGAALQLDVAGDNRRGEALSIGLAGQPFGFATLGRYVAYRNGFVDETVGVGTVLKPQTSHAEVSIDLNVRPFRDLLVPVQLQATRDDFLDRSSTATAGFRGSGTLANILVSGGVDLQDSRAPATRVSPAFDTFGAIGNLSASTFYALKWQVRSSLDFNISPNPRLRGLGLTVDRALSDVTALHLGYGRSFADGSNTLQAGAIFHTRYGDLSLAGDYTAPNRVWQLGLTFAFGLVFDPGPHRYVMTHPGPAAGGSVAFQAFVDSNGDGVYDAGEKPVPRVSVDGGEHKGVTGPDGRVFVTGLGSAPTGRLQVGLDDIDDPYVQSPPKTVLIAPRPGQVVSVPYPLVSSSEIIVHLVVRRDQGMVGLSALRVRLAPKAGQALETSTEYDGSANFETLRPGTYELQLDAEQAERLHMRLAQRVLLTVPAAGGPLPDLTAEVVFVSPAAPVDNRN
jgi:hypothetical protein